METMMGSVTPLFGGSDHDRFDLRPDDEEVSEVIEFLMEVAEKALRAQNSPAWTPEFWDDLSKAESTAREALGALWEASEDGTYCTCETCIVRVVLEAVMPTITEFVEALTQD